MALDEACGVPRPTLLFLMDPQASYWYQLFAFSGGKRVRHRRPGEAPCPAPSVTAPVVARGRLTGTYER
ncbi:hypothetical protein [Streptomyces sp. NPDC055681]